MSVTVRSNPEIHALDTDIEVPPTKPETIINIHLTDIDYRGKKIEVIVPLSQSEIEELGKKYTWFLNLFRYNQITDFSLEGVTSFGFRTVLTYIQTGSLSPHGICQLEISTMAACFKTFSPEQQEEVLEAARVMGVDDILTVFADDVASLFKLTEEDARLRDEEIALRKRLYTIETALLACSEGSSDENKLQQLKWELYASVADYNQKFIYQLISEDLQSMDTAIILAPKITDLHSLVEKEQKREETFQLQNKSHLLTIGSNGTHIPNYKKGRLEVGKCVYKECGLPTPKDQSFCLVHNDYLTYSQCIVKECRHYRVCQYKLYCPRHFQTGDSYDSIDDRYNREAMILLRSSPVSELTRSDNEEKKTNDIKPYYTLGALKAKDIFGMQLDKDIFGMQVDKDIDEFFKHRFADIDKFVFGILDSLDMTGLCLAGGAIVSILFNLSPKDYDLFLTTKDPVEAVAIIKRVYEHLKSKSTNLFILRNDFAITFIVKNPETRLPVRIQIITRLYYNITQVISGFDIDSCCVAWSLAKGSKGKSLYAMPRFIRALYKGYNLVDPERQSKNYHARLFKYLDQYGFALALPGYIPERVSPSLINTPNLTGLAKVIKFVYDKIRSKQDEIIKEEEKYSDYGSNYALDRENKYNSAIKQAYGQLIASLVRNTNIREQLNAIPLSVYSKYSNQYIMDHEYDGKTENFVPTLPLTYDLKSFIKKRADSNEYQFYDHPPHRLRKLFQRKVRAAKISLDDIYYQTNPSGKWLINIDLYRNTHVNELIAKVIVYSHSQALKLNYVVSKNLDDIFNGLARIPTELMPYIDLRIYSFINIQPNPLTFILCNPGSQISGSFHPTYDDWYKDLYQPH